MGKIVEVNGKIFEVPEIELFCKNAGRPTVFMTTTNRPLLKKAIFDKFKPNATDRQRFDTEIRRLTIVNEVSSTTTMIAVGDAVQSFYVVLVNLRNAECDKKNLSLLSKLIKQNMLFILEYDNRVWLAVFRAGKILESAEKPLDDWRISLAGLNLDSVWENIIVQIGSVTIRRKYA